MTPIGRRSNATLATLISDWPPPVYLAVKEIANIGNFLSKYETTGASVQENAYGTSSSIP
jgi:hypothetical protein